jgi:hypothetical protein
MQLGQLQVKNGLCYIVSNLFGGPLQRHTTCNRLSSLPDLGYRCVRSPDMHESISRYMRELIKNSFYLFTKPFTASAKNYKKFLSCNAVKFDISTNSKLQTNCLQHLSRIHTCHAVPMPVPAMPFP